MPTRRKHKEFWTESKQVVLNADGQPVVKQVVCCCALAAGTRRECADAAGNAGLGVDLVLPDQQWNAICPEGGILCANCICQRAKTHGGTVVLAWIDQIDYGIAEALENGASE